MKDTDDVKIIDGFPYNTKTGYLSVDDFKSDKIIELNNEIVSRVKAVMKKHEINKLSFGSPYLKNKDISFLKELSFLKGLSIAFDNFEFDAIYYCSGLEELSISFSYKGYADFSRFPHLRKVMIDGGNKGLQTIYGSKEIEYLSITHFNEFSFQSLTGLFNLKSLTIIDSANLLSLSGIENLRCLRTLFIGNCKQLKDISDIELLNKLESIDLYKCHSVEGIESIMYLNNLKRLNLDNMGDIPSIKFLKPLKKLTEFYMTENTYIIDGELGVLEKLIQSGSLKKVIFQNRRHYSHTAEDLGYSPSAYLEGIFGKRKQKKRKSK